jgi:hypothetical protein
MYKVSKIGSDSRHPKARGGIHPLKEIIPIMWHSYIPLLLRVAVVLCLDCLCLCLYISLRQHISPSLSLLVSLSIIGHFSQLYYICLLFGSTPSSRFRFRFNKTSISIPPSRLNISLSTNNNKTTTQNGSIHPLWYDSRSNR